MATLEIIGLVALGVVVVLLLLSVVSKFVLHIMKGHLTDPRAWKLRIEGLRRAAE